MELERLKQGLRVANRQATQSMCPRASVGAAIFNFDGDIVGEGYNKNAFGLCNCDCGTPTEKGGSSTCQTAHAEIMALLATDNRAEMEFIAVTRPPCYKCLNVLMNTEIRIIVTTLKWADRDDSQTRWEKAGRLWIIV